MSMIEIVIINGEGPFSIDPVRRARWSIILLIGMRITSVHAMAVSRIYRACTPEPALTRATERARRVQPMMSLPTPALKTTIPIVVSKIFISVRILAYWVSTDISLD